MTEHLIYNLFKILDIPLNCLWNSKRYCKDPLDALATMKITQKKQEMRKIYGLNVKTSMFGDVIKQFVIWNLKSLDITMSFLELKELL